MQLLKNTHNLPSLKADTVIEHFKMYFRSKTAEVSRLNKGSKTLLSLRDFFSVKRYQSLLSPSTHPSLKLLLIFQGILQMQLT